MKNIFNENNINMINKWILKNKVVSEIYIIYILGTFKTIIYYFKFKYLE